MAVYKTNANKQLVKTAGNGINADKNYMSEEQFTGKYWIDGKPIYKQVINFNIPSTDEKVWYGTVISGVINIDTLISLEGVIQDKNNYAKYALPFSETSKLTYLLYRPGAKLISIYNNTSMRGGSGFCIVEYTKT